MTMYKIPRRLIYSYTAIAKIVDWIDVTEEIAG